MKRNSVDSSNLASIGYDPATKTLEVEFNTGKIYEYYNVPENLFRGLMNAASHGSYFNDRIKNGGYKFRQIS